MRGLTGARPRAARTTPQAASTTTVVVAALALCAAGCGTGGTGARDEGPANGYSAASPTSEVPAGRLSGVDPVRLVKGDPEVAAEVKRQLKPCVADEYPVDVSYGRLTGGTVDDIVVNVLTCGDAVGVGSYVYRDVHGAYQNVFAAEEPPVYAEMDRGDLVVTNQVYDRGDPVSSPSGENIITYRWSEGRFVEEFRTHNDYGRVAGGEQTPVPLE